MENVRHHVHKECTQELLTTNALYATPNVRHVLDLKGLIVHPVKMENIFMEMNVTVPALQASGEMVLQILVIHVSDVLHALVVTAALACPVKLVSFWKELFAAVAAHLESMEIL